MLIHNLNDFTSKNNFIIKQTGGETKKYNVPLIITEDSYGNPLYNSFKSFFNHWANNANFTIHDHAYYEIDVPYTIYCTYYINYDIDNVAIKPDKKKFNIISTIDRYIEIINHFENSTNPWTQAHRFILKCEIQRLNHFLWNITKSPFREGWTHKLKYAFMYGNLNDYPKESDLEAFVALHIIRTAKSQVLTENTADEKIERHSNVERYYDVESKSYVNMDIEKICPNSKTNLYKAIHYDDKNIFCIYPSYCENFLQTISHAGFRSINMNIINLIDTFTNFIVKMTQLNCQEFLLIPLRIEVGRMNFHLYNSNKIETFRQNTKGQTYKVQYAYYKSNTNNQLFGDHL